MDRAVRKYTSLSDYWTCRSGKHSLCDVVETRCREENKFFDGLSCTGNFLVLSDHQAAAHHDRVLWNKLRCAGMV